MKRMEIVLSDWNPEAHNRAMIDLVEKLAEDCIEARNTDKGEGVEQNFVIRVPEQVARIFIALSNADCLYAEEIE